MNLETSRSDSALSPSDASQPAPSSAVRFVPSWARFKTLAIFSGVLALLFIKPLLALFEFALHSELFSHILLIPLVSGFLIWLKRDQFVPESKPNRRLAGVPLLAGAAVLIGYRIAMSRGWTATEPDYLAVMTFAFLCFLLAGAFLLVGASYLRSITFPIAFLAFMIPFPTAVRDALETFFQYGSTEVAYWMLTLSGMPVLRDSTYFRMPGFALIVGPECSGIHSSFVLFITSLLAGYMFLKTRTRRWVFVLSVIPLGLLRNGFRVFCLGQIGVRWDPLILDSWFHHQGGWMFFLLSLIPLSFLLIYLSRSEARKEQAGAVQTK